MKALLYNILYQYKTNKRKIKIMIQANEILKNKETFDEDYPTISLHDAEEAMIEFAKYHVEQALKVASEKALLRFENYKGTWEEQDIYALDQYTDMKVSKDSIINAYPLEKIK